MENNLILHVKCFFFFNEPSKLQRIRSINQLINYELNSKVKSIPIYRNEKCEPISSTVDHIRKCVLTNVLCKF